MTNKNDTEAKNYFNIVNDRMLSALSAYYIWKWLNQSININNDGGEERAKYNLAIINRHILVLKQIMISTYKSFVADLAFFFEVREYDDALSIEKLIISIKNISDDELKEAREKFNNLKNKHRPDISFLKRMRNSDVAHQALESKSYTVEYQKIEELFLSVQNFLNFISIKHDNSVSAWSHIEKDITHHMNWIFENLERGELKRLEDIKDKI